MSEARSLRAIPIGHQAAGKPHLTFERGRICVHDDCTTPVSIYNPGPLCHKHERAYQDEHREEVVNPVREALTEIPRTPRQIAVVAGAQSEKAVYRELLALVRAGVAVRLGEAHRGYRYALAPDPYRAFRER